MSSLGSPAPFFFGGATSYGIKRSLRFNDDDSPKLTRTFGTNTSNTTKTVSFWVKRGNISSSGHQNIFSTTISGYIEGRLFFLNDDRLQFEERDASGGTSDGRRRTEQVFRDTSAWYHIVLVLNSTESTEIDRAKIYVNGTQVTDFNQTRNISQNYSFSFFRSSVDNYIGVMNGSSEYFDGYLADIYFIDGQALTPASFAETNSDTGQWSPIEYTGTYGNNGFYLNFADNSGTTATTLGKDSSGNDNNFTPTNLSVTAGEGNDSLEDTPSLNYPTLNPIDIGSTNNSHLTFTNGNLQVKAASGVWAATRGTFAVTSGKWYWEAKILSAASLRPFIGIIESKVRLASNQTDQTHELGVAATSIAYWIGNPIVRGGTNTSGTSTNVPTCTTGDIVGVALDMDNKKVFFSKNGTFFASQDPANSSGELVGFSTSMQSAAIAPAVQAYNNTDEAAFNFGQRAFDYTPPTGYKKLNSQNLPTPAINFGNQHFNTILYTANGQNRSLTGVGFQPDWVWIKSRIGGQNNALFDSVRGVNRQLRSDTDGQEISNRTNLLTSFDSDGFSLGTDSNVGDVNYNSQPHVAWNWNAGNTDSKTYTVTVVSDSGNKYRFDGFGTSAVTLDLAEGGTYTFNYPSAHPLRFSTTADGTHGGGSEYTTGVSSYGNSVTITVAASAPTLYYYCTQHSGMGGQVNTNTSLGSSNFDGSIQSTVKANTTAGFSILTYTGNGNNATIGHGLGVKPHFYFFKRRTGGDSHWFGYHRVIGNTKNLRVDVGAGTHTTANIWNNTDPTSSVVNIGNSSAINANGSTYVAYVFSEVPGFSKFGSYNGNGNANGQFVYTGFKPAWLMIVIYSSGGFDWTIHDSTRNPYNLVDRKLNPNNNAQEQTDYDKLDFLSNGFKPRVSDAGINASTGSYVYFCFAESPFKYARAR